MWWTQYCPWTPLNILDWNEKLHVKIKRNKACPMNMSLPSVLPFPRLLSPSSPVYHNGLPTSLKPPHLQPLTAPWEQDPCALRIQSHSYGSLQDAMPWVVLIFSCHFLKQQSSFSSLVILLLLPASWTFTNTLLFTWTWPRSSHSHLHCYFLRKANWLKDQNRSKPCYWVSGYEPQNLGKCRPH